MGCVLTGAARQCGHYGYGANLSALGILGLKMASIPITKCRAHCTLWYIATEGLAQGFHRTYALISMASWYLRLCWNVVVGWS